MTTPIEIKPAAPAEALDGGRCAVDAGFGSDRLRMDYINSLPQPFIAHFYGGSEWPVNDIEVQTGLLRIDVCGLLEVKHIGDVRFFRDACGVEHDSETFYSDFLPNGAAQTRRT